MEYKTIKEISVNHKGYYGIGASSCDFCESFPSYLRITDISDDGNVKYPLETCIDTNKYPDWAKYKLMENDIVFARTGNSTGRNYFCSKINRTTVFAGFLIKFSINSSLILPKYVGYYCQSRAYWDQIKSLFTGSTRANVNAEQYALLKIPVLNPVTQQHIVNTIGSVDDLIENYQQEIDKICELLDKSLLQYPNRVEISSYNPKIIKSGIDSFFNCKEYLDTSSVEGVNNISAGEKITLSERPSRANMQPVKNSVWFAKMKGSCKKLIITSEDSDLVNHYILSTGFQGLLATKELPLSLLSAFVISNDFDVQRDLHSVGTTMAGINNETFMKMLVPQLSAQEIGEFDKKYSHLVELLSKRRKEIVKLKAIKQQLLQKYF